MITAEAFDAVIFDCDGTLIDSSDVHIQCMRADTQDQGLDVFANWYAARNGLDRTSLCKAFRRTFDSAFDVDRACRTSIAHYDKAVHLARPIGLQSNCLVWSELTHCEAMQSSALSEYLEPKSHHNKVLNAPRSGRKTASLRLIDAHQLLLKLPANANSQTDVLFC